MRLDATAVVIWDGAEYPRISPGKYLVRGVKIQGPSWLRTYSRWSVRIEFALVHESGVVSAFFNMGNERSKPKARRQSRYFEAWRIANGDFPRKGEKMKPEVFLDGQFFWVTVGDARRKADGTEKEEAEVYSRITHIHEMVRP